MSSAAVCVLICSPSAISAIEPKSAPPTISAAIMQPQSAITPQVRRSLRAWCSPRKTCSWLKLATDSVCILSPYLPATGSRPARGQSPRRRLGEGPVRVRQGRRKLGSAQYPRANGLDEVDMRQERAAGILVWVQEPDLFAELATHDFDGLQKV